MLHIRAGRRNRKLAMLLSNRYTGYKSDNRPAGVIREAKAPFASRQQ